MGEHRAAGPAGAVRMGGYVLLAGLALLMRDDGRSSRTAAAGPRPVAAAAPAAGADADAAPVEHQPGIWGIAKSVYARFGRDNASLAAAGVAFYMFLSLFPGLAALVSLFGLVADPNSIGAQIAPFARLLPPEAMKLLNEGLAGFVESSTGAHLSLALLAGVAAALWSARAAMSAVMLGLNIAFEETERRSFVVQTLLSLALTAGAVLFLGGALFALAVVPAVLAFLRLGPVVANLLAYGRWPVLAALVVLGFAVLYRFAPDRRHPRWQWISWGAGVAALVWLAGSAAFSLYVSNFGSYDATYGSLGAVAVLLLWFWVSALILLVGAEINAELEARDRTAGSPLAALPPGGSPPPP